MNQFLSCAPWRAVFCGAAISAATLFNSLHVAAQEAENALGRFVYEHEGVPLYGYVSDPKVSESVQEIADRYLSSNLNKYDLVSADFFFVFVDPEIVSEGKFVNPIGFELPEKATELFATHELSDEGCNVGRIFATNEEEKGDYLVWLVHGGQYEGKEGIESCLLFAAAASAGIWLADIPALHPRDLRQLLDSMILGLR
ncbi:hypothetical protein [Ruegeria sp.]|uniref:hypothetical protein n=1 Tax=Ruegeria sp. TaxID=1879320 RepID=UPI00231EEA4F|nr:hypothetical protein [Ruegeria sp.]MDA7964385.1 hypothetical protein [Ruegeria sp.]